MKAIRYYQYGGPEVLQLQDVDTPKVTEDRLLIRVRAASLNPYDWHFMRGKPSLIRLFAGITKPKNNGLGADLAGVVEAVGTNVTQFQPGDEVLGQAAGSFSEYALVKPGSVTTKPGKLTFQQAAAVPMVGLTALQGLRDIGAVKSGQKVLINGASGGIGTMAVQIAKALGAEVTGVCSTRNVELVKSLGAEYVVDYTKEDFLHGDRRYDLMLDNIGNRSLSDCRKALVPRGTYVGAGADGGSGGPITNLIKQVGTKPFVKQHLRSFIAKPNQKDLVYLTELIESGKLTPVIDRTYPLSEVPEAITYLETRRARGKIVITM